MLVKGKPPFHAALWGTLMTTQTGAQKRNRTFARTLAGFAMIGGGAVIACGQTVDASDDGREIAALHAWPANEDIVVTRGSGVPYGPTPDWQNDLRRQVGGLQAADMNGDGWVDLVVGCYISNSFPPYTDWENLIYYNVGGALEASPSWVSADEVSTGDIQVGFINDDAYPDIFAANGGFEMAPSVIYFGSPTGPSPTPGWSSAVPGRAWNNYALLIDIDHDGDTDVLTANQGNSPDDPYRPMLLFRNNEGTLETVPSWQSAETSIQNFLAAADFDGDGWEDIAVSKWANFESCVYRNVEGALATTPAWTTGNDDTDKGVAWADVDGNEWPDLALGHGPTTLYSNTDGVLTPTWTSTATYFGHSDLRFEDVDRDGDPDLAEVHFSDGRTHIYLNRGGVLDAAPTWTYDATIVGTALAFGDINGDGWKDLVIGYSGQPCIRVFYARPPACPGDLDGDRDVDLQDLATLLSDFGCSAPACAGDLDRDGSVGLQDLALLLANFGADC